MKTFFLVFLSLVSVPLWALDDLRVIFLEVQDEKGQTIYLEPDFPFAHVVLGVGGTYIHAHPRTGVDVLSEKEIEDFGKPGLVLHLVQNKLQKKVIDEAYGKAYDRAFSWSDERFYCSELVAKAIGILPEPMHFDPKLWPPPFQELEGLPGISPGKIYKKLKTGAFLLEETLSYSRAD